MKDNLFICLVQPEIIWEDIPGNLEELDHLIHSAPEGTDLIILPETFSTGFTMRADRFAEKREGMAVSWMQKTARERNATLTGSLIIRENGRVYNRLYWVSPGGIEGHYDKRHLFRMGREDKYFESGGKRELFTLGPFRFMPQICYDLRFPVFARNRSDYDVLFYVANWPAPRHPVWETLLRARAIENQAYVIGVNRAGVDGEGVDHLGGSCIIDPMGRVEAIMDRRPGILHWLIELKKTREFREKFPVWKDADRFTID
jgi:omega-amidase